MISEEKQNGEEQNNIVLPTVLNEEETGKAAGYLKRNEEAG